MKIRNVFSSKKALLTALGVTCFLSASAQNLVKGDYGYLYCHMSDKGEWTAYAVSRDGYNYQDIIDGEPIFDQTKLARIEGGTRDAFITRAYNGKGYVMVTTDMCVAKSHKWDNCYPRLSQGTADILRPYCTIAIQGLVYHQPRMGTSDILGS